METKGKFINWSLSMPETIAACVTVGGIVSTVMLWVFGSFQSKEDASKLELRVSSIELRIEKVNDGITDIAKDVSYIRGKLEPKEKQ
jgi:hypothetical protein